MKQKILNNFNHDNWMNDKMVTKIVHLFKLLFTMWTSQHLTIITIQTFMQQFNPPTKIN